MMKLFNCSLKDAAIVFADKKIIPFGLGTWFNFLQYSVLGKLENVVPFVIDNAPLGRTASFKGKSLSVYFPDRLKQEKNCIVILTSPVYMYDMYMQLIDMKLDESIECYAFPFMQLVTTVHNDPTLEKQVQNINRPQKIPKKIHSFWFSGDEKPDDYKRCVDTWTKVCPDYEIIEWTRENYDFRKHPFCKKAIELGAWAFAADYARLDVVYRMGGIYMDMDVELVKSLDSFLGNEAIFAFCNNVNIDLAFFGSVKENHFILDLLKLYDGLSLPESKAEFKNFFQPSLIADTVFSWGLKFNGSLQSLDGAIFFPEDYFMAFEGILYNSDANDIHTHAIHWSNFGWMGKKVRDEKLEKNRKLWELIEK